ncbi:MAG TPA: NTP transferase domain-containing protein [Chitinophagaceae bacterium]|nr:NTP transferase domain-containing protein [Chitinophagaceae bacterium]
MESTLLVLAAGMASRYGSMKQIQKFGPGGETIMDYSIFDARAAGFSRVVFVVRKSFEVEFRSIFEPRLRGKIRTDYVTQELDDFMDGRKVPADRTKPWGTAHAVLCASRVIQEPFAVINADDYYGQGAFDKMARFLKGDCSGDLYSVVGYELGNTLSEHGSVSRGVCEVDQNGYLKSITERTKIYRREGRIVFEDGDREGKLDSWTPVSMNFWGFHPAFFGFALDQFLDFVDRNADNPKAEFFIPIAVDAFIGTGKGRVRVIPTTAKWFGVTYKEDAPVVEESFKKLVQQGIYPSRLWT